MTPPEEEYQADVPLSPKYIRFLRKAWQHSPELRAVAPPRPRKQQRKHETKREGWLWRAYGIREVDFKKIWDSQEGKCAICKLHLVKPCVDHNHLSGEVRGLLCLRCNLAIGGWDDPKWAKLAAAYLGIIPRELD